MKNLIITLLFISFSFITTTACPRPTNEQLIEALEANPKNEAALYNLGQNLYFQKNYKEAAKHWSKLKTLAPTDWQVRTKLIQTYWADGKNDLTNNEIKELRKARDSKKHPELSKAKFFIRDQFTVGKIKVFTLEYYELEGKRPLAWKFILQTEGKDLDHHISLGSYPSTTTVARELKEIGEKDRIFHLDGYWRNGSHATYGMYKNQPNYKKIREQVTKILSEKKKPISETKVNKNKDTGKVKGTEIRIK